MSPNKWDHAVEKFASQIERDTGAKADREKVTDLLSEIGMAYDGARYWKDDDKRHPHSLAALEPAINDVIAVLTHDTNGRRLCVGDDSEKEQKRLRRVVRELELLRERGRSALVATEKPRSRRDHDLYDVVKALRNFWVGDLDQPFKNEWHTESSGRLKDRRLPKSNAARFVYSAMTFIDRKRLGELEKVMANIIGNR